MDNFECLTLNAVQKSDFFQIFVLLIKIHFKTSSLYIRGEKNRRTCESESSKMEELTNFSPS